MLAAIWQEVRGDKAAMTAFIILIGILTATFSAGFFIDLGNAMRVDLLLRNSPPSPGLWLGTDPAGRDILPQLLLGARNSFIIAFSVTLACGFIGTLLGLISGFYGGRIDNIIMRILDFFLMLPTLMIIIALISTMPHYGLGTFVGVMICFIWADRARLIRAKTLQQAELGYVEASRTLGTPGLVIMLREVLPNLSSIIVVNTTLTLATNMGLETGLTFLGFGLPFGTPSLGTLIAYAATPTGMMNRPWQWLPAAILVFTMMLCIYTLGQVIAKAMD